MWAKSAPPSRSKILRLRSFISGKQQPDHLLVVDRPAVQRPQRAVDADDAAACPTFRCKSLPSSFTQRAKQLVDLQLLLAVDEAALDGFGSVVVAIAASSSLHGLVAVAIEFRRVPLDDRRADGLAHREFPARAITRLVSSIVYSPKWKMLAARAASALPIRIASARCSGLPAPPLATTGIVHRLAHGAR